MTVLHPGEARPPGPARRGGHGLTRRCPHRFCSARAPQLRSSPCAGHQVSPGNREERCRIAAESPAGQAGGRWATRGGGWKWIRHPGSPRRGHQFCGI